MKYAIQFFLLACCMVLGCWQYPELRVIFVWSAASFFMVAVGYAGLGPKVLGKTDSGRIAFWPMLFHLPYRLITMAGWYLCRWVDKKPAYHQVNEGLWIGRRLLPREFAQLKEETGEVVYLDLTAEMEDPSQVRLCEGYLCFPILDASVPSEEALDALLEQLGDATVYVHCAQGHGRTGLLATAILLHRGHAKSVEAAMDKLASIRSGVVLNAEQDAYAVAVCQ